MWHSKRFCWFYVQIMEDAWSVTLFLLKSMKKLTLQAFWLIWCENHGKRLECHTFLAKKHEKCDTPRVLAYFMWKSLKTLGVSHFSCKKHEKCDTSSVFADFRWKSLVFDNTLCFFMFFGRIWAKVWECYSKMMLWEWFLELIPGIPGIRGIPGCPGNPGIPGSGVTKCGSGVSFHARPLVRMTGV